MVVKTEDTAHLKPLLFLLLFGRKTILIVDVDVENVDDTSYSGKLKLSDFIP